MPLQRLTMEADYSERPIYPLCQRSTRNQPRAVLISSTRTTKPTKSSFAFFNTPLRIPHRDSPARRGSVLVCRGIQGRLAGCGPFHPGLNFKAKTRKFEDFSVDGEVAMVRGIPTPLDTLYPRRNMVPKNVYVNDLNFVLPPRLISQTASQSTTVPNPEDLDTSLTSQHPATQNLAGISTSSQPPNGSESNGPVTNWSQAVLSSCVVGVALVAVATGYACTTVFRGALNVGQFVYTNRESIRQTATTCTKAVQSTYNAAKRRMISIPPPRLPVGMRRRYAAPTTPHARSWRCPLFRRSRIAAQSPAQPSPPINPVVSTLAPEGMPGVEYSGLSNAGQFPDTKDAADPDAFILPRSSNALATGALPYMTGGLFRESIPPPPAPSPVPDQPASNNISGTPYPDGPYPDAMELTEQPCICYEESVFSDDIEDEYEVEDRENTKVPTAELFKEDAEHMALEEDFWSLPGQFEPRKSLTNPQAKSTSASPVFETAPPNIEANAPIIEHASPATIIESESPLPTPPGAFPPPPPSPGRPTPSPPPPSKAIARQEAKKSRKRRTARGANKMAKSHVNHPLPLPPPPPPPLLKRRASSPPKDVRRSNRIAELKN